MCPFVITDEGVGLATDEDQFEKAAAVYQSAADTQTSAVAFWNLGWMYENGLGVPQVSVHEILRVEGEKKSVTFVSAGVGENCNS